MWWEESVGLSFWIIAEIISHMNPENPWVFYILVFVASGFMLAGLQKRFPSACGKRSSIGVVIIIFFVLVYFNWKHDKQVVIQKDQVRKELEIKDKKIEQAEIRSERVEEQLTLVIKTLDRVERSKVNRQVSPEKIRLFVNSKPLPSLPLDISSGSINSVITICNDADITLKKYRVTFSVYGCKVESDDVYRWVAIAPDDRFGGMTFYAPPPQEDLEPNRNQNLSPIKISCNPGLTQTRGEMTVFADDMKGITYNFTIGKP